MSCGLGGKDRKTSEILTIPHRVRVPPARTVFSSLIPPGREARFFGLYSITDKSSSFFGVGTSFSLSGSLSASLIRSWLILPFPFSTLPSYSRQPAIVGLIADLTGQIRYGFVFLLCMLLLPLPVLMWKVDLERGRERAKEWGDEEGKRI